MQDTTEGFWFTSQFDERLPGVVRDVIVPTPAAGAEWSVNVPGGVMWQLYLGTASLTTSAAGGNRFLGIQLAADGIVRHRSQSGFQEPPSTVGSIVSYTNMLLGENAGNAPPFAYAIIPPDWIQGGWTISSWTINLAAGDTYTNIRLLLAELWQPANLPAGYKAT